MIRLFQCKSDGVLLGEIEVTSDMYREGMYLFPAYSTTIVPPEAIEGFTRTFSWLLLEWEQVEDEVEPEPEPMTPEELLIVSMKHLNEVWLVKEQNEFLDTLSRLKPFGGMTDEEIGVWSTTNVARIDDEYLSLLNQIENGEDPFGLGGN